MTSARETAASDYRKKSDIEVVGKELSQRTGFLLRRCLQNSSGIFAQACGELDLTARQYDYLSILGSVGQIGQGEIGELLGLDRATNTLVLKILERKRWISRRIVKSDTRRRVVKLTTQGHIVFARAQVAARSAKATLTASLSPKERQMLCNMLLKIIRGTDLFLGRTSTS